MWQPLGPRAGSLEAVSTEETFDLAAAGLRADGTDLRISVEVLASKLEQALPGQARVERHGGGLLGRGEKRVRRVQVKLGSNRYQLNVDGGRVSSATNRTRAAGESARSPESTSASSSVGSRRRRVVIHEGYGPEERSAKPHSTDAPRPPRQEAQTRSRAPYGIADANGGNCAPVYGGELPCTKIAMRYVGTPSAPTTSCHRAARSARAM